ncbi:probable proline--tRNA ligase, mitochondrial isoform X1 [Corvus kubaryi]|uniref:probable proline--tRNA ligase, mitochondrial isoform X1 n=1 Tax=Corvus kubaryi TaxID=68294 RepID=UPI001C042C25|nr:probable proline--tRNA ligase, mitochondrial isoform X1 [Corvus kubaryi]
MPVLCEPWPGATPPTAADTPPGRQVAPAAPGGTIESGARRPRPRVSAHVTGRGSPLAVPAGPGARPRGWPSPSMEALLRRCRLPALGTRQRGIRARHGGTPGRARRLLLSQLFQPLALPMGGQAGSEGRPGEPTCRSQRLMLQGGLIHPTSPGCYCYLPPTVRAMEKLIKVMDEEMQAVGGQKLNLPSLCSAELWRASGRWDQMGPELFRLVDRHNHGYCLGPTHEEVVTELVASQSGLSYKQLPLRLYQVTRKFRDEPKPRFGLLRSREFYMKDMYTFDTCEEAARHTYEQVCDAYCSLFTRLGLPFVKVQAATGSIGGTTSHEFQLPADIGEDRLVLCPQGHFAANVETLNGEQTSCPTCGEKLTETKGIEVGHTFYLGTKYSSVANAVFSSAENKPQLAEMGCYGLGVTRILAASIEVLSTEDSIRWPSLIAPFQLCFIPPKRGSKEEEEGAALLEWVYDDLAEALPHLAGDSVLDDRTQLTIGKRLKDANRLGYPYVVVAGKRVCEDPPVFEVWNQNAGEVLYLTKEGVIELLSKVQVP